MTGGGIVAMEPASKTTEPLTPPRDGAGDALAQVRESLRGLKFGSVNIIVQDGVIIQIDRTEKRRLRSTRNHAR